VCMRVCVYVCMCVPSDAHMGGGLLACLCYWTRQMEDFALRGLKGHLHN